jgi:CHAT domain-containing protein
LRQQIWDPLLPHLSSAARVFVVPDGALHLVSFAALPTTASRYLVETGPLIHYLSTERDLLPSEAGGLARGGLLALGGPAFDESSLAPVASQESFRGTRSACSDFQSMRFDPLPASLKEVDDVVALWNQAHGAGTEVAQRGSAEPSPDTIRLTGAAASESAFKAKAAGRRVLHLATHGFFLGGRCASALDPSARSTSAAAPAKIARENPLLLSGLILAGANLRNVAAPDQEDGVLTAEEVAALNLSGVEWTVLSGCDTGVGEVRVGEGVFGLRRAFQVAGVKTVIMSLWPVEDQATHQWMTALYAGRLMKKLSTADAVREASLAVLRQRRAKGFSTHPFHWAGFVGGGDWR